jgi:fructose-1,6-bisphosphatase/inositol monophosphatase family enzyme
VLHQLEFELSHETRLFSEPTFHVDDEIVSISFVDSEHNPVVGVVSRPWTNQLLYARDGGGAYHQMGDEPPVRLSEVGFASERGTVLHTPCEKSTALEQAIESLEEKMNFEVTRKPCSCCCEGLFELVSGRADVHLSPPQSSSPTHTSTPVPVLCAFEVLLRETGGYMSACNGEEVDYASLFPSGDHRGGILASNYWTHNYMLFGIQEAFIKKKKLSDTFVLAAQKKGLRLDLTGEHPRFREQAMQ